MEVLQFPGLHNTDQKKLQAESNKSNSTVQLNHLRARNTIGF